jgi:transcriptional regulator with XRE-family HTH domain
MPPKKIGTRSVGQCRLLKLSHKHTQERIARRCGVSQASISLWISGRAKPEHENRMALMIQYGIELDAWDRYDE